MKLRVQLLVLATLVFTVGAFAQLVPSNTGVVQSPFQVRYFANLNIGDSYIDMTNDGSTLTTRGSFTTGNICVNVYAFDPAEELVSCCTCLITPNALVSLSVRQDLTSNTLTPATPTSITAKLMAVTPSINSSTGANTCNAATLPSTTIGNGSGTGTPNLSGSLHAWGTTLHANTSTTPTSYNATETEFSSAQLLFGNSTDYEAYRITSYCGFIQAVGSGFGICKSCRTGGLGAARQ